MKNFSNELKSRTKNMHKAAESTGFIKRLQSGQADKKSYAEYILNLLPVYEAIESSLDSLIGNERIAPLVTKELYKSELIKKDIEFILGDEAKNIELLESTKAYVKRIEEMKVNNPIGVVAHAYTRFLADLFGGRTFAEMMKNDYKIEDAGLNYYNMDGIGEIMPYVMGYHTKLAKLSLTEDEIENFITEVGNSYVYNTGISTELEVKLFNK